MPPRLLVERWFFKMYNWKPDDVKKLDLEYLTWLPIIEAAEISAEDKHQKAIMREQNTRSSRS